jgi:hypothetical protein
VRQLISAIILLILASSTIAQQQDIERYVREHQPAIIKEFLALLAIPNVRSDLPNIKRNAELLRQMLDRRGMGAEIWETPSTPLVYGERLVPGSTRTVLFYIHFDGQPVNKTAWKQADPFEPILRAGTIEEGPRRSATSAAERPSPTRGASTPVPLATTRARSRCSSRRWMRSAASRRTSR